VLDTRVGDFGDIIGLSLNTSDRSVHVRCALRGESEPIDVVLREYSVEQDDAGAWLTVGDATASREWLTAALRRFCVGRRFRVSSRTATALRLFA
jgi:hypothetical protein